MDALENAAAKHSPSNGLGGEIIPLGPCDVTSKTDLENLIDALSAREKHLDVLVAAAGISGPKADPSLGDATELRDTLWESEHVQEWDEVFRTNVTGVYLTTVACLPLLQAGSKTRGAFSAGVVVISSMSGLMSHAQGNFAYNAAKGATVHLGKMMSAEFEKLGVRVNQIAPGYFPTEMTMGWSEENQKTQMPHEKVQEKGHVPAERPGSEEEMAQAVLLLARNRYVNGECLVVDGGTLLKVPGR
jgi:NAD(P)-dependent dehydrogenase (short-subunit alcohol dehydrogenase family)